MDRLLTPAFALALLVALTACKRPNAEAPLLTWTMLAVNETPQQADAHLLKTKDGRALLIDVGFSDGSVLAPLKKHRVGDIDAVLISHPHKDHYGGLWSMLQSNYRIKTLYMNLPDRAVCDREKPWGCDYDDLLLVRTLAVAKGVVIRDVKAGQLLFEEGGVSLKALVAYNGIDSPVGVTDINDTSVIARLQVGPHKVLFTGDLNKALGTYLAQNSSELHADILKVPHHGTEGVAPDVFFERVSPFLAMVPSPTSIWVSDRSKRIRQYFEKRAIPTLVSGSKGDVTLQFFSNGWKLSTER